jgi:hypothetical protein
MIKLQDALIDNRPREEKEKDYDNRELAFSAVSPDYTTRKQAEKIASRYVVENQFSTSSCAAHSGARCLGIHEEIEGREYKKLAPAFIYGQRINKTEGMFVYDLGNIGREQGCPPFEFLPTPKTEKEINEVVITEEMRKHAAYFKGGNSISINNNNIENFAEVSNNLGLPICLFVYGSVKEWSLEEPTVLDESVTLENAAVRHLVAILPGTAHIYKKKKYVTIIDSSLFGKRYIRHLSEDFFNKRVLMGMYWMTLENPKEKPDELPKYNFTRDLWVGCTGQEVNMLQEALKALGFFPDRPTTEYYGGITRKAVEDFQKKYERDILWILGLKSPTGYFGKSTRNKLNQLLTA